MGTKPLAAGKSTLRFEGLKTFSDKTEAYIWQRKTFADDYSNWDNSAQGEGIAYSCSLKCEIDGAEIPVYVARAAFSSHSFAFVEISGDAFPFEIRIKTTRQFNVAAVLPEKHGVKATAFGQHEFVAVVKKTGTYTFVFDSGIEDAITVMVRKADDFAVPAGYKEKTIGCGDHPLEETEFTEEKTVYRFRAGNHIVRKIFLPSNSVLYFEPGAYVKIVDSKERPGSIINARGKNNVKVCGRGLLDFSSETAPADVTVSFFDCKNVRMDGLTLIDSPSWTVCFTACENVEVSDMLVIAYRIFADGIMLSDCVNGYVHDSFLRTGDDAAEVKSTSDEKMRTDNILFKNLDAWTDKGCGYGIVFECNHDTQNVRFEDCSIGFALPNWSRHLGCLTVNTGNNAKSTDYDIYFKNIEIYYSLCSAVSVCAYEGDIHDIFVDGLTVKYLFSDAPVLVWVRDADKAHVKDVYLGNVSFGGIALTEKNQNKYVVIDVPDGVYVDSLVHIDKKFVASK